MGAVWELPAIIAQDTIQPISTQIGLDFLYTFSMALYHKWDVKNGFAYVLQFFSLISEGLGGVDGTYPITLLTLFKLASSMNSCPKEICPNSKRHITKKIPFRQPIL